MNRSRNLILLKLCLQIEKHLRQTAGSTAQPLQCSDRQADNGGGSSSFDGDVNNYDDPSDEQIEREADWPTIVQLFRSVLPEFPWSSFKQRWPAISASVALTPSVFHATLCLLLIATFVHKVVIWYYFCTLFICSFAHDEHARRIVWRALIRFAVECRETRKSHALRTFLLES